MKRNARHNSTYSKVIGKRIGKLTVLAIRSTGRHILAHCRCDCGNTKAIRISHIFGVGKSGKTKSCGCLLKATKLPLEKIVSKTFGFLTVLSGRRDGRNLLLRCKCFCGAVKEIRASEIKGIGKAGATVSCGCKRGHHNKTRRLQDSHELFLSRLQEFGWTLVAFSINSSPSSKSLVCCPNGHNVEYTPSGFRESTRNSGTPRCPHCSISRILEEANALAKERGGQCLTNAEGLAGALKKKHFTGSRQKLDWLCSDNHSFQATLIEVRDGHWCAPCAQAISERKCRAAFEQLFRKPFPASIPDFLKVSRQTFRFGSFELRMGRAPLRLDGYCRELRLAFEHHGHQHYFKSKFYGGASAFRRALLRDIVKRRLCRENGVRLFSIPMLGYYRLADETLLKEFIRTQSERLGVSLPEGFDNAAADLSVAYKTGYAREQLKLFNERLQATGRRLVEEKWLGGVQKHRVICACGSPSTAVPFDWERFSCPHCVRKKKTVAYQHSPRISEPVERLIAYLQGTVAGGKSSIAEWARAKILQLRKRQARGMVKLPPHQLAKLQELGVFDVEDFDNRFHIGTFRKRRRDGKWNNQVEKLKAYAAANGHTRPPVKSELGSWAREQIRCYREKRLPQWRREKLEAVKEWRWNNEPGSA